MIAPAIHPAPIFKALPIHSKAIPTVATVDQELPVAIETMLHTITAAIKKMVGFKTCNP